MWKPTEEDKEHLVENFYKASMGRFSVEVKWRNTDAPSGEFQCRLMLDDTYVFDELKTENPDQMMSWTLRQLKEAARRGKPCP